MAQQQFSAIGILWRVLFSLALVFLTFNPSGHSFYHWVKESVPHIQPVIAICGILLLGAWLFFVRSTVSSMGAVGVVLLLALFAAIVWWMVSQGWLSLADRSSLAWIVLTMLGLVLGIGMSWAHIRQRISGQASVDRVDNG
jgi:drug/metabolite transporter (DMT)-like permease